MYPVDGSSPTDFQGIDYAAYFRGLTVYDSQKITDLALDHVGSFLDQKGLSSRRCFISGMGAGAGGPAFMEFVLWVQEHWGFLSGFVSGALAAVGGVLARWRHLKRRMEDKVLDPYQPSVVVELGVRSKGDDDDSREEASRSFKSVLTHVPELNALLRTEMPDQKFTIRVLTTGDSPEFSYAYFRVPEVKRSDAAKMLRVLDRKKDPDGHAVVVLYRQFGIFTRVKKSGTVEEFMRFTMR